MFAILHSLAMFVIDFFKSPRRLEAENLFLRHQLSIALRRAPPRLRLRGSDRALMVWLTGPPRRGACRSTGDHPSLASCWFHGVLALEIAEAGRTAKDRSRVARSYPTDEQGKPKVGSISDPWRAVDARLCGRPVDGLEIHGAGWVAVAGLEYILPQPRAGDRGH